MPRGDFGFRWHDKPLHDWPIKKGHALVPLTETVYKAAGELYRLPAWEVDKMPIEAQVDLAARYECWERLRYLSWKEEQDKAEMKRKERKGKR